MLDFKLPVYILRAYEEIKTEGDFTIVCTAFTRYVLDNKKLSGTFSQRRLQLVGMKDKLPYKLYPIRGAITMLSQLVASNKKHFVDSEGNIIKWNKTTFYRVVTEKVISSTQIFNGKYQCYTQNVHHPFILAYPPKYISYILVSSSPVIYAVHQEEPESPRHRVKL